MTHSSTHVDGVVFVPGPGRFEGDVIFAKPSQRSVRRVHVSVPGHIAWTHKRTINALVAAAKREV
ncbi:hypothetical protein IV417_11370 [Alphaproteobacteria bacterium KMM 3653]|uniref:Uncharacterized protein n=1 Tax=Harenicola maris TaxID=2841044 RepID=A0AAP2CRQ4_9RHOB|nr:hypothetical protein [Harenicola maris]